MSSLVDGLHPGHGHIEAIHGRPSLWHNILSGGTIGFLGVASGRFGVPFVSVEMIRYRYGISPPGAAFGVYGSISGLLAGAAEGPELGYGAPGATYGSTAGLDVLL